MSSILGLRLGRVPLPHCASTCQQILGRPMSAALGHQQVRYQTEYFEPVTNQRGTPLLYMIQSTRPTWQPMWEEEYSVMPRDGYGVPGQVPPEVSTTIKHVYYVPPQFYAFLKKLGDDTPTLRMYTSKLIEGDFTHDDYEEMFYKFVKPLKIYRSLIPLPYRTPEEIAKTPEVNWESAWLSYRQRVLGDYTTHVYMREYLMGMVWGFWVAYLWVDQLRQYRVDMKLFYLDAPEHKINWVKPRGDL